MKQKWIQILFLVACELLIHKQIKIKFDFYKIVKDYLTFVNAFIISSLIFSG